MCFIIKCRNHQQLFLQCKVLATLHRLETLTYCATNDTKHVFDDVSEKLENIYSDTYKKLPATDGLVLRPQDQRQVINARCRIWKAKITLHCSALKSLGRKKPCSYRNRFGIKVDRLRKEDHDKESEVYTMCTYTLFKICFSSELNDTNNCTFRRLIMETLR